MSTRWLPGKKGLRTAAVFGDGGSGARRAYWAQAPEQKKQGSGESACRCSAKHCGNGWVSVVVRREVGQRNTGYRDPRPKLNKQRGPDHHGLAGCHGGKKPGITCRQRAAGNYRAGFTGLRHPGARRARNRGREALLTALLIWQSFELGDGREAANQAGSGEQSGPGTGAGKRETGRHGSTLESWGHPLFPTSPTDRKARAAGVGRGQSGARGELLVSGCGGPILAGERGVPKVREGATAGHGWCWKQAGSDPRSNPGRWARGDPLTSPPSPEAHARGGLGKKKQRNEQTITSWASAVSVANASRCFPTVLCAGGDAGGGGTIINSARAGVPPPGPTMWPKTLAPRRGSGKAIDPHAGPGKGRRIPAIRVQNAGVAPGARRTPDRNIESDETKQQGYVEMGQGKEGENPPRVRSFSLGVLRMPRRVTLPGQGGGRLQRSTGGGI